ncbi:NAD(P)/FAD-dependent oxidoreductase [Anaeromicropila populeti]|uniref:Sarcosine oxidase subunit beta n=1 Tax=Anaeromicropila populeti TaxID=37658 RepID=A0A1I6HLX1_9FIRM|nr:FAD-binding oxidoreductase [Anaeromicropila populeti]SFR55461.1 sarcosine oxidase subunit beta [Anaeromicropila populeti]
MKAYDVVVIGAGAIGTSVAYHLCEKGYEVALIDHGDIANGSSSHCDAVALICDKQPGLDTQMGAASIALYKELAAKFSYDFEFDQKGCLYVCETESEYEAASAYANRQAQDGYDMSMVDAKTLAEMEPYLAKDLIGGIWTPGDAAMSPYKVCFAFTEEAKKLGLKVYTYCSIQKILLGEKNQVEGIETDQGTIYTKKIINCAGVWAPDVGKMAGIEIPIQPRKGMNLISEKTKRIVWHKILEFGYMMSKFDDINFKRNVSPLVEEYNVAFNIEYTNDSNILLGGYRGFRGFDARSEIEAMKAIAERGMRFFPCLKDINCIRSYAGVRPFVVDHLPIVSDVEAVPGFYIAAGHEGDGICLSPITGKIMAQVVAGEKTEFDISKLKFSRFEKNVL